MFMEYKKSNLGHICNIWALLKNSLRNPQMQKFLIKYIYIRMRTHARAHAHTHARTIFICMKWIFRFYYVLGIVLSLIPRSSEANKQTER